MMFWIIYFIVVTYLQLFNSIVAHAFNNLLLCVFVFFPISERFARKKLIERIRYVVGLIVGLLLLWHESYLPSVGIFWQFLTNPELRPSSSFVVRFIFSAINLELLAAVFVTAIFAYFISHTKFRKYFGIFFICCFFIIGLTEKTSLDSDFAGNFYDDEAKRVVNFSNNSNNDFDVVIFQVCSFSWDDLVYLNYDMKPFFKNFDYIFTNFNSATSYSNTAALRILKSTCGQTTEEKLFENSNGQCYLMDNLRKLGYSTYTVLNHDGNYSSFNDAIVKYGKADVPLDNSKLIPTETSFDGTPIYLDKDAFPLWFTAREADGHNNSALFYNSITLHTGIQHFDSPYLSNNNQYNLALNNLTNDVKEIFDKIKKTNRKTIVVLVGEHGAAIRGSALQPATVREIPLPQITQVPAVIKFFGPGF
ncbi:MAG: cellulose biosynthesis protein BcsG, partial [Candidatus Magasanikbacteria bacterium]